MINSEVIKVEDRKELDFPKLMISENDVVILATGCNSVNLVGMVLDSSKLSYQIGHHSNSWHKNSFKDFDSEIRLKNDDSDGYDGTQF